ncbi:hypothetical protein E2542_SST04956 [Spatholobus suberectus]|nr:hypothetical protein E2542_SST04956 [Spatholobus suberectus]
MSLIFTLTSATSLPTLKGSYKSTFYAFLKTNNSEKQTDEGHGEGKWVLKGDSKLMRIRRIVYQFEQGNHNLGGQKHVLYLCWKICTDLL